MFFYKKSKFGQIVSSFSNLLVYKNWAFSQILSDTRWDTNFFRDTKWDSKLSWILNQILSSSPGTRSSFTDTKLPTLSFFKKMAILGLFFIFIFSIQLTVNVQYKFLPVTGFEPTDLWYWKRPLYQLNHNHCLPTLSYNEFFFRLSRIFLRSQSKTGPGFELHYRTVDRRKSVYRITKRKC